MARFTWLALPLAVPLLACTTMAAGDPRELVRQAHEAYQGQRYQRAAETFAAAIARGEEDASLAYNAACSYSLAGDKEQAFRYLNLAIERGFDNAEHLQADTDLQPLHGDERWAVALEQVRRELHRRELRWNTPALNSGYRDDLNEDEKIAGLSKLWAEVRYNFAWFEHVPELDWDRTYLSYLPRVRATKSTAEYYLLLRQMCALLKDGHTQVVPPPELRARRSQPRLRTRWIEGKVLVVEVRDEQAAREGVVAGLEILELNGTPVRQYAEREITPFQSASTPQDLDSRTYERALLEGPAGDPLRVTFANAAGERFERTLQRPAEGGQEAGAPVFEYKALPGNIAYVALNSFGDPRVVDEFDKAFEAITRSEALVLDVRENGGGDSSEGYRILAMLTAQPFKGSRWRTREYRPTERAWGRPERYFGEEAAELPADGKRLYSKPVVLLTSARTYSAAEDFAVAFDAMGRGPIIGEPTGGSTGQPLSFKLPGGGFARVCTKQDAYPDGRPFVGVGLQPHRRVQPTAADVRAGRDTILEAALDELQRTRAGAHLPSKLP